MSRQSEPHPHLKAYVCTHVFQKSKPVLLVTRPEGDWCFLCGEVHPNDPSSYKVVGIGHLLDADPSLHGLMDLEPEWEAERQAVGQPWMRTKIAAN